MTDNLSLKSWLAFYESGAFDAADIDTQCRAGWYDWFCRSESLAAKTHKLAPKVKRIARSSKVNIETMYVFFKNNCPVSGSLYDDFRICDMETGDVIWTIIPKCGHKIANGRAELWGRENDFAEPILTGTMQDIYAYFGV